MTKENKNPKQGFTLLELLVVILIIGILAAIALPQYKMAVTKAKVASILPIMRRWKDALTEWNLQHGTYLREDESHPDASDLGANWPSNFGDGTSFADDYWTDCIANELGTGDVFCWHDTSDGVFMISMFQYDDPDCEVCRNKIMCFADGEEGNKVCKVLGGKSVETDFDYEYSYTL